MVVLFCSMMYWDQFRIAVDADIKRAHGLINSIQPREGRESRVLHDDVFHMQVATRIR